MEIRDKLAGVGSVFLHPATFRMSPLLFVSLGGTHDGLLDYQNVTSGLLCSVSNKKGHHRHIYLNAWFLVVGTVWQGLEGIALLEEL